ncbi:GNAT family N-acetyltransferase [Nocardiopsis sp. CNT312]|uniref:GNAT family N-acetyltransferase n=1 Tax=Nocardiopsis sp. CNT312 TaxID=1137268 RepID=UPI000491DCA2|nr:GNAT family N-acetyltransferase [Nocardiopsis sp. CNT312]
MTGAYAIRPAEISDLEGIREILNHFIRTSDATLDYDEKSEADMESWYKSHNDRYPVYVCHEESGRVVGYASLSPFAARAGYQASAEISVYVREEAQSRGTGIALCERMTSLGMETGFTAITAIMTSTNKPSIRMVEILGYQRTGSLRNIGAKFGRPVSLEIYQIYPQ